MRLSVPKLNKVNCAVAFLASAFQAFGMYNVHAVSGVTEGGVLGATLLIDHWFGISPTVSSFLITAACFFLGFKTLGKEFIGYSLFAAAGFSAGYRISECFPPLWPVLANMPLTAAFLGAVFIGIGAGLCIRVGGATCGDDALAMSLHKLTKIPIQWIYLCSDLLVLMLSLSYIPFRRIFYSLLTVTLSGQIIALVLKIPETFLLPENQENQQAPC